MQPLSERRAGGERAPTGPACFRLPLPRLAVTAAWLARALGISTGKTGEEQLQALRWEQRQKSRRSLQTTCISCLHDERPSLSGQTRAVVQSRATCMCVCVCVCACVRACVCVCVRPGSRRLVVVLFLILERFFYSRYPSGWHLDESWK
jgi:hypothetical protein